MNKKCTDVWIKGLIAFISILIIGITTVAPIVSKAPSFIFTNKIGYFIFNFYYGTIPSLCFTFAVQGAFIKFNLANELITYSLIVNLTILIVIQILKKVVGQTVKSLLVSGIALTAISRPLSLSIIALFSGNHLSSTELVSVSALTGQAKVYIFTTIGSVIFCGIVEKIKSRYLKRSDYNVS